MTDNNVTLPSMDLCFGNCPQCHKTHGCYGVGPDHWYVCHTHRTKWPVKSSLFSTCMSKQPHACMLADYREVEPWLPDDVQERRERQAQIMMQMTDKQPHVETMAETWQRVKPATFSSPQQYILLLMKVDKKGLAKLVDGGVTLFFSDGSTYRMQGP